MAKFFGVDPEAVGGWANADFLDRQEYMFVIDELERRERNRVQSETRS